MPRMSGKKAKLALQLCIKRDGPLCYDCAKRPARELHHLDDDRENNPPDGSNWWGLCHSCHRKMHPRGPNKPKPETSAGMKLIEIESVRENVSDSESEQVRPQTMEMLKNSICEPKFKQWLSDILDEVGVISVVDAKNGGAYIAGCSPQAIQRYLDVLCSFVGPYEFFTNEEGKKYIRRRQARPVILPLKVVERNKGNDA